MRLIDRYIGRTVLTLVLTVLLALTGIDTLFAFLAELEELSAHYGVQEAAVYILATIPRRLYDAIPQSALLGCLLALGGLANTSELIAMRAAGVRVLRLVVSALKPIVVLTLLMLLVAQYGVPEAERFARSYRSLKQSGGDVLTVRGGSWHREGAFVIHVGAIQLPGMLYGITRYQFDANERLIAMHFARRAVFQADHWALEDQDSTYFYPDHTDARHDATSEWLTQLTPDVLAVVVLMPEHLSLSGLYAYATYLGQQGVDAKVYRLAFWKKVLQPAATLVMVLLALSFIFGPLRSVTMGFRIVVGLVVGFLFVYGQELFGYVSVVFGLSPLGAVLLPIVLFLGVSLWLLRRVR